MAVAAVLGVVTAVVGWRLLTSPEWRDDGPLEVPPAHGYIVRYDVGEVFTDGLERLVLHGHEAGVLRGVELVGPGADHLEIVGLLLAGRERKIGAWQTAPGFPPRYAPRLLREAGLGPHPLGRLVPALGATLPVGQLGTALQIGIKVVKPGLAIRTGVRVRYTVGDRKFSAVLPGYLANCPTSMTNGACERAYLDLE